MSMNFCWRTLPLGSGDCTQEKIAVWRHVARAMSRAAWYHAVNFGGAKFDAYKLWPAIVATLGFALLRLIFRHGSVGGALRSSPGFVIFSVALIVFLASGRTISGGDSERACYPSLQPKWLCFVNLISQSRLRSCYSGSPSVSCSDERAPRGLRRRPLPRERGHAPRRALPAIVPARAAFSASIGKAQLHAARGF